MADVMQPNIGARRAADALLRQAGGRVVLLRVPSPGTPGDPSEQLGLATPAYQDVQLAPAVFRKSRSTVAGNKGPRWELLISALAVETVVGSLAFESASVLFAQAYGVLVDETLLEIEAATASQVFGMPYVYRLQVRAPLILRT